MSKQRSNQSTSGRSSQASSTRATTGGSTGRVTVEDTVLEAQVNTGTPTIGEQARAVTEQAKDVADSVKEKATQKVESGLTKAKGTVAESLHAINQSLLISGQQLRDRNQQSVSRYVDQLANRVERAASYLQNSDVGEIIDRTEDYARRRPAVFLGGAFVLGLLGARFLKSSKRGVESGEWGATSGGGRQSRYIRERTVRVREDVAASPAQEEWAALRTAVTSADLADVPNVRVETQSLGESGLGRQPDSVDYDAIVRASDASRR